ncbi:MAG TPA: phosphonatase-like hydrolase [Pseudonocardiaceae bacterium]|nr:phosphonatase-like hydrolase [Pseudonocardiaceae bacterium]
MTDIELVVLDMAGTTVLDDGLVLDAFTAAVTEVGVERDSAEFDRMLAYVNETMGQSKIVVFRALLDGDEQRAASANAAFEARYDELVHNGHCAPVPGAEELITRLRAAGVKVAFVTGFGRQTQDAILTALGWNSLADLALTPADAGRGRPFPDLVLASVLRTRTTDVRRVAVLGDTPSDVLTGLRAGASIVAGVLTGAGSRAELEAAGATHVLDSVADLPGILG